MYQITLPYPVSVNKLYSRTRNGGLRLSDAARAFKQEVAIEARNQDVDRPLLGRIGIVIYVFPKTRRGDLDNLLKITLDSLNGIVWVDDKQIDEIHVHRKTTRKVPSLEITIYELPVITRSKK